MLGIVCWWGSSGVRVHVIVFPLAIEGEVILVSRCEL